MRSFLNSNSNSLTARSPPQEYHQLASEISDYHNRKQQLEQMEEDLRLKFSPPSEGQEADLEPKEAFCPVASSSHAPSPPRPSMDCTPCPRDLVFSAVPASQRDSQSSVDGGPLSPPSGRSSTQRVTLRAHLPNNQVTHVRIA